MTSVRAADLALVDAPLFLSLPVKPNLIMAVDDSLSMDFELLLPANDGAAWWRSALPSGNCSPWTGSGFTGCISDGTTDVEAPGQLNFNHSGAFSFTWWKYAYLFPNGCNSANDSDRRRFCDERFSHFAIAPVPGHAWARAAAYNPAYFDPAIDYEPWVSGGGFTFADSNPTSARFDPVFGSMTIDLTRDVAGTSSVDATASCGSVPSLPALPSAPLPGNVRGTTFRVLSPMTLPPGTCFRAPGRDWEVATASCVVGDYNGCETLSGSTHHTYTLEANTDVWIRYFPATFYLGVGQSLPADYGYTGLTVHGIAPDGTHIQGYEIKPANFATTAQYQAAIQNFANWFTYYRKRHQALRAGLGKSFNALGGIRIAGFTINEASSSGPDVTMADIDDPTEREALYNQFYEDWVRSGNTPNRTAVANLVRNFRRTDANAPITRACQKNFGMLFTDGFSNPPAPNDGISVGNVDGSAGSPYADAVSNTLADCAMDAYVNRLRADMPANKVSVPADCDAANPDPRIDCNDDLHMNFYAVTLNTRGLVFDPDNPSDPYQNPPTWPTFFGSRHASSVDDLWHATINGRGQLLNARTPTEVSDKLSSVLRDIVARQGSAASASVNSSSINSETRLFQARFNSVGWTGELLSWGVNVDGTLDNSRFWSATDASRIPVANQRKIITASSAGTGVPFRWSSLEAARQAQLQPLDSLGEQRLEYLRGDSSAEQRAGGPFRNRAALLGDIVNSAPAFVGRPSFLYRDDLESKPYSEFSAKYDEPSERSGVVYVGANDGMLHAFAAETGSELFAYVPGVVFENLHHLTSPTYSHRYYADGSPTVGDAFLNDEWRTVLVAGLNKGGQGMYALDVTEPDAVSEASASRLVLWEFTDAQDADLGFTFSRPAIVRLHNGRWAAVFGNGYNNTAADGAQSASGNAVLYVVDLESGNFRKIDTGVGSSASYSGGRPNGLATPAVVDVNGDQMADFAYAGDLLGNLWKFDLRSADPANWRVAYESSGDPAPLFVARRGSERQPITSRPEVTRAPNGRGLMVLFGTGKYLEPNDELVANSAPQSFYGIVDRGTGTTLDIVSSRSELTEQQIIYEGSVPGPTGLDVRVTTQNASGSSRGWFIDLISPANGFEGEMQVTDSVLRNGRIVFTTLIPNPDDCDYGGRSWLMELDALSGGRLDQTPFDMNNDGEFNEDDWVVLPDGTLVPASGLQPDVGITPSPAVLAGDGAEFKFLPGTTGGVQVVRENPGPSAAGRQSWRQLR